jgi:hypothetical protein
LIRAAANPSIRYGLLTLSSSAAKTATQIMQTKTKSGPIRHNSWICLLPSYKAIRAGEGSVGLCSKAMNAPNKNPAPIQMITCVGLNGQCARIIANLLIATEI